MSISENPDIIFGKLLCAIQTQNQEMYITAIEQLGELYARDLSMPHPVPEEDLQGHLLTARGDLWRIAGYAVSKQPPQRRITEICEVLCDGGYLQLHYELNKPNPA